MKPSPLGEALRRHAVRSPDERIPEIIAHDVPVKLSLCIHLVFIPKYRKLALRGDVAARLRGLIREICARNQIEIVKGPVRPEHVHLLLSVPPSLSPSRVMQLIKGKSSHRWMRDFRSIRKEFWGRHLWARGYFVATTGNVTDEVIAK